MLLNSSGWNATKGVSTAQRIGSTQSAACENKYAAAQRLAWTRRGRHGPRTRTHYIDEKAQFSARRYNACETEACSARNGGNLRENAAAAAAAWPVKYSSMERWMLRLRRKYSPDALATGVLMRSELQAWRHIESSLCNTSGQHRSNASSNIRI